MKRMIFVIVAAVSVASCWVQKEVEVEVTRAELIRIDTVYRYPGSMKQLTWKDDRKRQFTSFTTMDNNNTLGEKMTMLSQK